MGDNEKEVRRKKWRCERRREGEGRGSEQISDDYIT